MEISLFLQNRSILPFNFVLATFLSRSLSLSLSVPQEEINAEKRRAEDEQKKSRIIILPDEIAPNANMRKVDIEAVRPVVLNSSREIRLVLRCTSYFFD